MFAIYAVPLTPLNTTPGCFSAVLWQSQTGRGWYSHGTATSRASMVEWRAVLPIAIPEEIHHQEEEGLLVVHRIVLFLGFCCTGDKERSGAPLLPAAASSRVSKSKQGQTQRWRRNTLCPRSRGLDRPHFVHVFFGVACVYVCTSSQRHQPIVWLISVHSDLTRKQVQAISRCAQ